MSEGFIISWQTLPFHISPVAFSLGSLAIRWYSLSYLIAFLTIYLLLRWRIKKEEGINKKILLLDELMLSGIVGLLIGARVGYVLFYDLGSFFENPFSLFWPFSEDGFGLSGMSFHGGLLGVLLAVYLFCRKKNISFWDLADFIIPAVPLGYFFGRVGNFLNGELFGRETDALWGMIFPTDPEKLVRHPSQLYEAIGEGLLIFAILWPLRNHPRLKHKFFGLYLILYGLVRFIIEFVRQPDLHLGFVLFNLTMGQILSLIMVIAGAILLIAIKPRKQ